MTQPLGSLSRRFREARGRLSQERAAAALGLSARALTKIETGEQGPTVGQLVGAAELYGTELRSLLFGRPAGDPALAHLGPDLAELVQEYLRSRHGVERVDQLDAGQRDDLDRVIAQMRRLGGLVDSVLKRHHAVLKSADRLSAIVEALRRNQGPEEGNTASGPYGPDIGADLEPGYSVELRSADALRAHHAVFRGALEWYGRTGGRAADEEKGFYELLPWLEILLPTGQGLSYLYCGELSPPAELWGEALARSLVGQVNLPDECLDRATAPSLITVHRTRRPLMQAMRGPVVVGGTIRMEAWHRFVMPLQFRNLACVGSLAIRDVHQERLQGA